MVALMDLHIPHGGQPSQVSQSTPPHSFIQPVHEVEVRYAARQDLRPYDSFVPTHPCFQLSVSHCFGSNANELLFRYAAVLKTLN